MLTVCKTCASSYHIPREILGENGCQVLCVGCGAALPVMPEPAARNAAPTLEGWRPAEPPRRSAERAAIFSRQADGAWAQAGEKPRSPGAMRRLRQNGKTARAAFGLLAVAVAMGAVAERAAIVQAAPDSARLFAAIGLPVNLRGLALDNVHTNIFDLGDRKMLVVEGAVANLRDSPMEAPNMRIALRDVDKRELYVWTAPAPKAWLAPNEHVAFRTRLAAPPEGVKDVLVKFAAVGDKLSPVKDGL